MLVSAFLCEYNNYVSLTRKICLVLALVSLFIPFAAPIQAQQEGGQYFPQTGHNVIGEFWAFYQSVSDAAIVFGAPITEQFLAKDGSGKLIQYFERARFELDPSKPVGQRVQTTDLGTLLYKPRIPSVNLTTPGACRIFPNGIGVCYDFLKFYDQHGGKTRFGDPISGFEFQQDGRIVQYFEKARFEYYPERGAGNTVRLADLGRIYFHLVEDPSLLNAVPPSANIPRLDTSITSLKVTAFVWRAVTLPTDTQKVYVVVQDQALKAVNGATGTVVVHLTNGQDLIYPFTTNASGIAVISDIRFSNQTPGDLIEVNVKVSYQNLEASTTTSFRIWR